MRAHGNGIGIGPWRRRGNRTAAVAAATLVVCAALAAGPAADAAKDGSAGGHHLLLSRDRVADDDDFSRGRIVWSQFVDLDFSASRIASSDPDGHHVRALTHPGEGVHDFDPQVSPDGRLVAFERDVPDPTYGEVGTLGIVGANGRGERVLDVGCVDPCFSANQPTWTPDGRHLLFSRIVGPIDHDGNAASAALWRTDLRGEHVTRVSPHRIDGHFEDGWAQFAPAGYVVFLRGSNTRHHIAVFRMNLDGSDSCRLTPWWLDADLVDVSPATSGPTKDLLVFETYGQGAPAGQSQAIATASAECEGDHRVRFLTSPTSLPVQNFNPAWSPDGRQVTFVRFKYLESDPIVHGDIWRMRWNGKDKRPVSQLDLFEFRPNWGPTPDDDDD